ncbi:MAG: class I SAM-dependent methyltransferase, partial [Magnetococcales bacterium]|nr:class I SAM-dependent methyltransferase [Magnetococcales bacterium]
VSIMYIVERYLNNSYLDDEYDELHRVYQSTDAAELCNLGVKMLNQEASDYVKAVKLLRMAANERHKEAQFNLGMVYSLGYPGVPQDLVHAFMWFNVAASQGESALLTESINRISVKMTPEQIAEARLLASIWKPCKRRVYDMVRDYFQGYVGVDTSEKYLSDVFINVKGNGQSSLMHASVFQAAFFADNLLTFGKNLSFLEDEDFLRAFNKHSSTQLEKSIIWRTVVLCWAAKSALMREGDFVECGCYRGTSARIIADYIKFSTQNKKFYLYDMFQFNADNAHVTTQLPDHGPDLYRKTKERFSDCPNVSVIQGKIPDVLHENSPKKIAFLHIDMNNAPSEISALEVLFDRVSPGCFIILDDYGYLNFRKQKEAEDEWLKERGYSVLELPTGQGLVIK